MSKDNLQEMLDIQKSFQIKYNYKPHIHNLSSAIMAEGGELWAISGGKWWKKYHDENRDTWGHLNSIYVDHHIDKIEQINRAKILEESIDIWHFLLTVWWKLGLTAEDVFNAYTAKMGVNHNRQDTNY
jgi:hypothetical protein